MSTVGEHDGPVADGRSAWQVWQAELVERVRRLADGEGLVLDPGPGHLRLARPTGRTGLKVLVPGRKRPLAPRVRLVRSEDHLRGHLTGATRHGGPYPWTDDELVAIEGLGWHRPSVGDGEDFVRFWPDDVPQAPYLPLDDARRAVDVVGRTLRTLLPAPADAPDLPPAVLDAEV